jgi:ribosomal protein RSM22 (predicted rRNA methylase)
MTELPADLRSALDDALSAYPQATLAKSVERLSNRYRAGTPAAEPILGSETDVAAYAGYRMPATYAAIRAALEQTASLAPDFSPKTHADFGGGTGAAVWAAADTWPSLTSAHVVEQVTGAIALGRRIAAGAKSAAVRNATWHRGRFDPRSPAPEADLVTLAYVLGELPKRSRADVVRWLAVKAGTVVLVEPGTPAGYERVLAARDVLTGIGRTILAPCPHDGTCPIPAGDDWCHFAARLPRSGLHRQLKAATLGFEDEKFSFVAATASASARRGSGRVLRHPQKRKSLVLLRVCTPSDGLSDVTVSKRQGDVYRAARDVAWGDEWPTSL